MGFLHVKSFRWCGGMCAVIVRGVDEAGVISLVGHRSFNTVIGIGK